MGVTVNQTLALALPGACDVQTPSVSQCNGKLTFLISPKFGIVFVFPILVHSFRKTLKTCLNLKPSWGPGKKILKTAHFS